MSRDRKKIANILGVVLKFEFLDDMLIKLYDETVYGMFWNDVLPPKLFLFCR